MGGKAGAKAFPCCAASPVCGQRLLMGTLGGEAASPCLSAAARCPVTVCACRAFCCFGVSLLARFSGSLSLQGVISSELEQPMLQLR